MWSTNAVFSFFFRLWVPKRRYWYTCNLYTTCRTIRGQPSVLFNTLSFIFEIAMGNNKTSDEIRSGMSVQDLKMLTAKREYKMMVEYYTQSYTSSKSASVYSTSPTGTDQLSNYEPEEYSMQSYEQSFTNYPDLAGNLSYTDSNASPVLSAYDASYETLYEHSYEHSYEKNGHGENKRHSRCNSVHEDNMATFITDSGQHVFFMHGVVNVPKVH